jgi:hypothetical protein
MTAMAAAMTAMISGGTVSTAKEVFGGVATGATMTGDTGAAGLLRDTHRW